MMAEKHRDIRHRESQLRKNLWAMSNDVLGVTAFKTSRWSFPIAIDGAIVRFMTN